jgi:tetratricopeptide (TPR) repeat protein
MPELHRTVRRSPILLSCVLVALPWLVRAAEPSPRPAMHKVSEALQVLVPIAYGSVQEAWGRPEVRQAVKSLKDASSDLVEHAQSKDATFELLSGTLRDRVRLLQWNVQRGDFENAEYFTQGLVETCVACHARLPNPRGQNFSATLLRGVPRDGLDAFEQAKLETAGRQFDAALGTYEKAFASTTAPIGTRELSDSLAAYLTLALRVQRDPERAKRGLAILSAQPNLPAQFERNLETWRQALTALANDVRGPASIERAQRVLDEGRVLNEFPMDAADEVHAIVASSLVYRYLDERKPMGEELGRALYLLARTQSLMTQEGDVLEAMVYLEQAIRAAPHTDVAQRAYAQLELAANLEFLGASRPGGLVEVGTWLVELRDLSRVVPPASR